MLSIPFFTALARQTMRDLKDVYEEESAFAPILFIHTMPMDVKQAATPVMRLASLGAWEQQEWPRVIRRMVEEAGATSWGLATEVSIRFHARERPEASAERTEELLVYLLCHQGGMLIWGASILPGRRLGPMREMTDDPRLQQMLAHLSEATPGEGN